MKNEKSHNVVGYIYIMTNSSLKDGIVKIGYADDVEKRRKELSNTSLPTDYEIYATFPTIERLTDKKIHNIIDKLNPKARVNKNREFFYYEAEEAFEIVKALADFKGTVLDGEIYEKNINKVEKEKQEIENCVINNSPLNDTYKKFQDNLFVALQNNEKTKDINIGKSSLDGYAFKNKYNQRKLVINNLPLHILLNRDNIILSLNNRFNQEYILKLYINYENKETIENVKSQLISKIEEIIK